MGDGAAGLVALVLALAIAVAGAGLVLLRDRLSGLVDPEVFVGLLGTLQLGLGALLLLTSGVEPDLLAPLVAAWGAVSGILLLAQGLRLRRVARSWGDLRAHPPPERSDRE